MTESREPETVMLLEGRIDNLERRMDAHDRPCEEGLTREHLAFHWRYSESVAAELGEIKSKLFLIGEKQERMSGVVASLEAKVDRLLGAFAKIMEVPE